MKKTIFFFILLIFFSSFKDPFYVKEAKRISSSFIREVCSTDEFRVTREGGRFMHGIEGFAVFFRSKKPADIQLARKMLVDLSEKFLHKINLDVKVYPYLIPAPFTISQICLLLSYPLDKSFLSMAMIKNGKLYYTIENDQNITETIHTETLEEALNAIKQEPACI